MLGNEYFISHTRFSSDTISIKQFESKADTFEGTKGYKASIKSCKLPLDFSLIYIYKYIYYYNSGKVPS